MVGSSIVSCLTAKGYKNLIFRSSKELDLRDSRVVNEFMKRERPRYVFLAAAKVGGILANRDHKGEFIYDNLAIQTNVIHGAHCCQVTKLLFLGSSCIYPKLAPQPLKESSLLSGPLEPTNEPYAIAKIAGLKMCQAYHHQYGDDFISVMPTSLYGPNDNYHPQSAHVLPALLRKFHEARINGLPSVEVWGSGKPLREFMHVDDLAAACYFLMLNYHSPHPINVGVGEDISIGDLAQLIKKVVGYGGTITFNENYPDGTPRKLLDSSKLQALGWEPRISLERGILDTYEHMKRNFQ